MKIFADFNKVTGKIRPMHGVGQPPVGAKPSVSPWMHYMKEAGIPFSRLHDVGGMYGKNIFVDIPNVFRNFDADENLPESYDFTFTDELIETLFAYGVKPFFRLGVTIENFYETKTYRIFPPKDFDKWARICEHIIRHYNEGWADGYHYGIEYWEIWNEPEGHKHGQHGPMWYGTPEQYFHLYEVASNHLKKCFGDSIKVGGYSTCDFGMFKAVYEDPDCVGIPAPHKTNAHYHVQYMHDFFKYITSPEHKAPIDYFSWHTYRDVRTSLDMADYIERLLKKYGFEGLENCLTEWNTEPTEHRGEPIAAAKAMSMMLGMQKKTPSLLCFYDAQIGVSIYAGLFNAEAVKPRLTYFAFMMFNQAYKLENEVKTTSDSTDVFVCGAKKGNKSVLLLSNIGESREVEIEALGVDLASAEVLMISDVYSYSPTGIDISDGKLHLPKNSCAEIRFY
ncbi:MAG: hypothetical protein IJW66_01820 [Clostridia bacterium]|nr:hypothetical protein [Clostridia bacterium]